MPNLATFLNKPEAAYFLRISQRKLDRCIEAGDGPPLIRLGRRIIFERDKVIAWAAAKTVQPNTPAKREETGAA